MRTTALLTLLLLAGPAFATDPPAEPSPRMQRLLDTKAEAEPFKAFGDEMIGHLAKGDAKPVRARMSPFVVERQGAAKVDEAFATTIVPYFAKFDKLDPEGTALAPTADKEGRKGFVIQYVFIDTDGERRSLVMFVLREGDAFTIANIIPGRSLQEASRVKPKP